MILRKIRKLKFKYYNFMMTVGIPKPQIIKSVLSRIQSEINRFRNLTFTEPRKLFISTNLITLLFEEEMKIYGKYLFKLNPCIAHNKREICGLPVYEVKEDDIISASL